MQSHLEVIQTHPTLISLWILVGSVLGGLLLLALLVFCLWPDPWLLSMCLASFLRRDSSTARSLLLSVFSSVQAAGLHLSRPLHQCF